MNERELDQIELIASHEVGLAGREIAKRLEAIFAEHSARGRLQSGATIKVSVEAMEQVVEAFLSELKVKFLAVGSGTDAFTRLQIAVQDCLNECASHLPRVMQMARGGRLAMPPDSTEIATRRLFDSVRSDIETKLDILRFEFEREPQTEPMVKSATIPPAKPGGRPPAAFWDDLWAAIAVALYVGELVPKTQADIEGAMADWLEGNGHSAAESTIRARARRLWDGIVASEQ